MKKKLFFALAIIVLAMILIWGSKSGCNNANKNDGIVKIGVILPMSGNSAVLGEPKKRAFEIAMDQYNNDGERLKVVFEDNFGTASGGTNAFNKMLLDKDFDCYYIDLTPVVNACIPLVDTHKVLTFVGTAEVGITEKSDFLYRIFAGGDQEIKLIVNYLRQHAIKRVFVLHTNEQFGTHAYMFLENLFSEGDEKIIGVDKYPMGNADFKSQLAKVKAANPEKVILLGYGNEYASLLKQAKEYGITPDKIVCNLGGANNSVAELPTEFTNGLTFVGPRFAYLLNTNSLTPKMQKFVDTYKAKYNENPYFHAAYAYDMVSVFMDIYGDGTKSKEQIMSEIKTIRNYNGVTGKISFKDNGDSETDLVTAQYLNGAMDLVK